MNRKLFCRLGLTYALFYLAYTAFFPFQTIYLTSLGHSQQTISLLSICTALGNFLIQFPVGHFSCKIPSRRKFLGALMFCAVFLGFLPLLLCEGIIWSVLAFLPVTLVDFTLIGQLDAFALCVPDVPYSMVRAVGSLSGALATLVLGKIYAGYHTWLMFPLHGICMSLAMLSLVGLPKLSAAKRGQAVQAYGSVRPFFSLFLGGGMLFLAWRAILVYLPLLLVEQGGTAAHQGLSMSLMSFGAMPVLLLYPYVRKFCSCRLLVTIGGCTMAVRAALIPLLSDPQALAWVQILEALSYGLLQPAVMDMISQAAPDSLQPRVVALWTGIQMALCTVVSNVLIQFLTQWLPLSHCFFVLAVIALAGLLPVWSFTRFYTNKEVLSHD